MILTDKLVSRLRDHDRIVFVEHTKGHSRDLTPGRKYPVTISADGDAYIRDDVGDLRWVHVMIDSNNVFRINTLMVNK